MDINERPALGELKPGDMVLVRRSANDMRRRPDTDRYIKAEVVTAARIWITIRHADLRYAKEWRMRRDTQDEATQYSGSNCSFVTPAQHEYDERLRAIDTVIRDAKVRLDNGCPNKDWTPERREALAELIISLEILTQDGEGQ